MGSIEAVILDVDGTVATCPYDFDGMRAEVRKAAARWGLDVDELGVRGIIEQMEAAARRLGENGRRFRDEAEGAVREMEIETARTAELLPGAAEALTALRKAGFGIALITRNCRPAAEIVLRDLRAYDLLLTRDDVPNSKPDPDHVNRALEALGQPAKRAAVVGDHGYDMEAGKAAGVSVCIGVRTGSSSDASLLEAGADVVIDSVADLPLCLTMCREQPQ